MDIPGFCFSMCRSCDRRRWHFPSSDDRLVQKAITRGKMLKLPKIVMLPGLCNVPATAEMQGNEFMQEFFGNMWLKQYVNIRGCVVDS